MVKSGVKTTLIAVCLASVIIFSGQIIVLSTNHAKQAFHVDDRGFARMKVLSFLEKIMRFGSTKINPRRITYITEGSVPTWKLKWNEGVISIGKPEVDARLAYYSHKDIVYYNGILQKIKNSIPKNFLSLNITDLLDIKDKFPSHTQKYLLEWAAMTRSSPVLEFPLRNRFYHLKLLLTKKDPDGQQIKCKSCFKQEFNTLISPDNICRGSNPIDLVGMVTTVPGAFVERQAIRDTWGKWSKNNTSNFRLIFLIGGGWSGKVNEQLRQEHKRFADILQEDYQDSYYNLTYKVISGFGWVVRSCPRAKFIMRSAGDSFVHIPYMLDLISAFGHEPVFQDYQVGRCLVGYHPYRWLDYKGFVSNMEYALDTFPPYALGTNFLTSYNLTKKILEKVPNTPYMSIEDSYFGILLWQMGRGCHDIEGFIQNDFVEDVSMTDIERWPYFAQHPVTPEQLYMLYQKSLSYRKRIGS